MLLNSRIFAHIESRTQNLKCYWHSCDHYATGLFALREFLGRGISKIWSGSYSAGSQNIFFLFSVNTHHLGKYFFIISKRFLPLDGQYSWSLFSELLCYKPSCPLSTTSTKWFTPLQSLPALLSISPRIIDPPLPRHREDTDGQAAPRRTRQ